MGYKNDVTAVFYTTKEKFPVMKLYVDENFPEEFKEDLTVQGERAYVFQIDGVKWYDSYGDVKKFNAFLKKFSEFTWDGEVAWNYEFMRLGENSNDVEHKCSENAEWVLNLYRNINVDI